ncbi:uncharacterized protein [Rutidosis leptorrhynchoides]|uniref:uncharacterized protein n=1 Tax=Rutidosis leptorrhynchoides TaxID=125765 RepID=UPI003A993EA8
MDAYLNIVDDDSSDDEMLLSVMRSCAEELDREAGEGSSQRPRRARIYNPRDRESAVVRLHRDYFAEQPTFPDHKFKRRYRMSPQLFERIIAEYLRKPTARDIQRIYERHETKHGFRGMLGSIDCMLWEWKNCPVAWQGSNNDINVLNRSPLFDSLKNGSTPHSPFTVNGHDYTHGYYLAYEDNGFAITSLDEEYLKEPENRPIFVRNRNTTRAAREKEICDKDVHNALRADLTAHFWNLPPNYRRTI